jgi:hypothetical protein
MMAYGILSSIYSKQHFKVHLRPWRSEEVHHNFHLQEDQYSVMVWTNNTYTKRGRCKSTMEAQTSKRFVFTEKTELKLRKGQKFTETRKKWNSGIQERLSYIPSCKVYANIPKSENCEI